VISQFFQIPIPQKTLFVFLLLLLFFTSLTSAQYRRQQFEIVPFSGYLFTGNLQTLDGELKIDNSFDYGVVLDIRLSNDLLIELLYIHSETSVSLKKEYYNTSGFLFDMNVEYLQGGVQVETEAGAFRPFAAFTIGATYFNPKDYTYSGNWQFSFTAGGGVKYYFTNNLGVRGQWRFLVPVYLDGASVFCNNGYCSIFISGGTYILQYDLTVGLIVSF
jgi:opacity protein-like surface antigen